MDKKEPVWKQYIKNNLITTNILQFSRLFASTFELTDFSRFSLTCRNPVLTTRTQIQINFKIKTVNLNAIFLYLQFVIHTGCWPVLSLAQYQSKAIRPFFLKNTFNRNGENQKYRIKLSYIGNNNTCFFW